jgi:hypothetical protein
MNPNDEPTTRDLIAIVAMHALLNRTDISSLFPEECAEIAYSQADAMLAQSEKK